MQKMLAEHRKKLDAIERQGDEHMADAVARANRLTAATLLNSEDTWERLAAESRAKLQEIADGPMDADGPEP